MYITVDDIKNKIFNRFKEETRKYYVEVGNDAIDDLYVSKVSVEDRTGIKTPVHKKLKKYAVQCALQEFASDNVDANNSDAKGSDGDVYERLFKRSSYQMQNIKKSITPVMFTGSIETPKNRAINPVRINFG